MHYLSGRDTVVLEIDAPDDRFFEKYKSELTADMNLYTVDNSSLTVEIIRYDDEKDDDDDDATIKKMRRIRTTIQRKTTRMTGENFLRSIIKKRTDSCASSPFRALLIFGVPEFQTVSESK